MFSEILGFDPATQEYTTKMVSIDPIKAEYILKYHNADNRKLVRSHAMKIANSISSTGWLNDGNPLIFNTEGNITEAQHRLWAIILHCLTVDMPVTFGVPPDTFTKTATAKPRRPEDEIQRKDPGALDSEVTTLRELVKRRRSDKLSMQNAIEYWEEWKEYIREGQKLTDGFFDRVEQYSSYRRTFSAWASMLYFYDREDIVSSFLDMLEVEVLEDDSSSTKITYDFYEFFKKYSWEMSNSGRTDLIFQLLCVCADRLEKNPNGTMELAMTIDKMHHDNLKRRGYYRKFLENPDNIIMNTLPV